MKQRRPRIPVICILCVAGVCLLTSDLWAHRTQGPLQGIRDQYHGTPVVEQTIQSGPYDIYFCAFDMGHEVHMIAYARLQRNGDLYQDLIRVSVQDPDGNAMTVYRDHMTDVLDEPIRWVYRPIGVYDVTVELRPAARGGRHIGQASFTMRLSHESPTSLVLISATGIIVATMLTVVILKRKRRGSES